MLPNLKEEEMVMRQIWHIHFPFYHVRAAVLTGIGLEDENEAELWSCRKDETDERLISSFFPFSVSVPDSHASCPSLTLSVTSLLTVSSS